MMGDTIAILYLEMIKIKILILSCCGRVNK